LRKLKKRPESFLSSDVDGELIIVHGKTGAFFALKDVGYEIWRKLDEDPDLAKICEHLEADYDVAPQECRQSVAAFADELVDAGFAEYL
jgi:hypothetical protein